MRRAFGYAPLEIWHFSATGGSKSLPLDVQTFSMTQFAFTAINLFLDKHGQRSENLLGVENKTR